ncbi:MAG: porin [Sulfurospirillaceae bacterium]|nr:porin [Sulfurospirillaceae bacterium]
MIKSISNKLTHIALIATLLYAIGANADDLEAPVFSFSGFGTLGLVHSSEDKADFTSSSFKPNGAGYTHAWSADVDSLIGGQVTANFTPKFTAILQVIAEQNYDNTYRPHIEWGNIKYQFTPNFSIRVGRTVLPTFLFSGTRKVTYTYPWVRPPMEVYSLVPVSSSDGVDIQYRIHISDFTHTIQANYGRSINTLPDGGTAKAEQAWGVTYSLEYHDTTVHLAYQHPTLTIDSVKALFDAFRQFGPQGIALADKYDTNKKPLSIITVGATYNPGKWFVMAEWTHTQICSFRGKGTGWYVSGGYQFGKFTPYITYAQATADNLSDPGLATPAATGLNMALNGILRTKTVQNTVSIGGRWDFMTNAALKLQYDHTSIGAGSNGLLINTQPGFQPGGNVNVFSATIEFVF